MTTSRLEQGYIRNETHYGKVFSTANGSPRSSKFGKLWPTNDYEH